MFILCCFKSYRFLWNLSWNFLSSFLLKTYLKITKSFKSLRDSCETLMMRQNHSIYITTLLNNKEVYIKNVKELEQSVYSTFLNKESWVLDLEATVHICCNRAFFSTIKPLDIKIS